MNPLLSYVVMPFRRLALLLAAAALAGAVGTSFMIAKADEPTGDIADAPAVCRVVEPAPVV